VSYNTWGSGLLATGTDALGTTYTNGFQLYLKADGTLTVKVGTTEYAFTNTLGSTFSIDMAYDGEGTLTVTTTAADGQQETKTIAQTLTAITTFATAMPAGIDITRLVIDDPWLHNAPLSGCTALTDITVSSGSPLFTSTDGLLYDAKGAQLVAYPRGTPDAPRLPSADHRRHTAGHQRRPPTPMPTVAPSSPTTPEAPWWRPPEQRHNRPSCGPSWHRAKAIG